MIGNVWPHIQNLITEQKSSRRSGLGHMPLIRAEQTTFTVRAMVCSRCCLTV
jgi:hypothetical protein